MRVSPGMIIDQQYSDSEPGCSFVTKCFDSYNYLNNREHSATIFCDNHLICETLELTPQLRVLQQCLRT